MSLVQMTLSGGAFILFIVVIRALALHCLPKGTFLVLWEMAALRLLLPFTISLPFCVFGPIERLPVVREYMAAGGTSALGLSDAGLPSVVPAPAGTTSGTVLSAVWLAGVVLVAVYFTMLYVRARRRFRCSSPDNTPAVRQWLAAQTLRRPLEVRRSALVSSPLTYGILRPVILLPEDMERSGETALTCTHNRGPGTGCSKPPVLCFSSCGHSKVKFWNGRMTATAWPSTRRSSTIPT